MIDDRLYEEKEIKELLPLEVMCEIPNITTAGEEKKRQKIAVLGWAATGLELVIILAGSAFSYFRG
jgi:hypothetical protein